MTDSPVSRPLPRRLNSAPMLDPKPAKAPDAFRTISEVAEDLDLPQHVLRFWETRFNQIKPMKRGGGRRYYRPEEVDLLRGIRLLLYSEGFTIRGVQRLLKEKGLGFVIAVGQTGSMQTASAAERDASVPVPQRSAGAVRPQPRLEPARSDEGEDEYREENEDTGEAEVEASGIEVPPAPRAPPVQSVHARAAPMQQASPPQPAPEPPPRPPGLSRESRRLLESALADLVEAKRLVDQAR